MNWQIPLLFVLYPEPGSCWNIGYPFKVHLEFKYREIPFIREFRITYQNILNVCTEMGNGIIMDQRAFARCVFKLNAA